MKTIKSKKLVGIIIASNWNDEGEIVEITLQAINDDEYLIEKNNLGEKLISYNQQKVELVGKIKRFDGKKIINVQKYKIINMED